MSEWPSLRPLSPGRDIDSVKYAQLLSAVDLLRDRAKYRPTPAGWQSLRPVLIECFEEVGGRFSTAEKKYMRTVARKSSSSRHHLGKSTVARSSSSAGKGRRSSSTEPNLNMSVSRAENEADSSGLDLDKSDAVAHSTSSAANDHKSSDTEPYLHMSVYEEDNGTADDGGEGMLPTESVETTENSDDVEVDVTKNDTAEVEDDAASDATIVTSDVEIGEFCGQSFDEAVCEEEKTDVDGRAVSPSIQHFTVDSAEDNQSVNLPSTDHITAVMSDDSGAGCKVVHNTVEMDNVVNDACQHLPSSSTVNLADAVPASLEIKSGEVFEKESLSVVSENMDINDFDHTQSVREGMDVIDGSVTLGSTLTSASKTDAATSLDEVLDAPCDDEVKDAHCSDTVNVKEDIATSLNKVVDAHYNDTTNVKEDTATSLDEVLDAPCNDEVKDAHCGVTMNIKDDTAMSLNRVVDVHYNDTINIEEDIATSQDEFLDAPCAPCDDNVVNVNEVEVAKSTVFPDLSWSPDHFHEEDTIVDNATQPQQLFTPKSPENFMMESAPNSSESQQEIQTCIDDSKESVMGDVSEMCATEIVITDNTGGKTAAEYLDTMTEAETSISDCKSKSLTADSSHIHDTASRVERKVIISVTDGQSDTSQPSTVKLSGDAADIKLLPCSVSLRRIAETMSRAEGASSRCELQRKCIVMLERLSPSLKPSSQSTIKLSALSESYADEDDNKSIIVISSDDEDPVEEQSLTGDQQQRDEPQQMSTSSCAASQDYVAETIPEEMSVTETDKNQCNVAATPPSYISRFSAEATDGGLPDVASATMDQSPDLGRESAGEFTADEVGMCSELTVAERQLIDNNESAESHIFKDESVSLPVDGAGVMAVSTVEGATESPKTAADKYMIKPLGDEIPSEMTSDPLQVPDFLNAMASEIINNISVSREVVKESEEGVIDRGNEVALTHTDRPQEDTEAVVMENAISCTVTETVLVEATDRSLSTLHPANVISLPSFLCQDVAGIAAAAADVGSLCSGITESATVSPSSKSALISADMNMSVIAGPSEGKDISAVTESTYSMILCRDVTEADGVAVTSSSLSTVVSADLDSVAVLSQTKDFVVTEDENAVEPAAATDVTDSELCAVSDQEDSTVTRNASEGGITDITNSDIIETESLSGFISDWSSVNVESSAIQDVKANHGDIASDDYNILCSDTTESATDTAADSGLLVRGSESVMSTDAGGVATDSKAELMCAITAAVDTDISISVSDMDTSQAEQLEEHSVTDMSIELDHRVGDALLSSMDNLRHISNMQDNTNYTGGSKVKEDDYDAMIRQQEQPEPADETIASSQPSSKGKLEIASEDDVDTDSIADDSRNAALPLYDDDNKKGDMVCTSNNQPVFSESVVFGVSNVYLNPEQLQVDVSSVNIDHDAAKDFNTASSAVAVTEVDTVKSESSNVPDVDSPQDMESCKVQKKTRKRNVKERSDSVFMQPTVCEESLDTVKCDDSTCSEPVSHREKLVSLNQHLPAHNEDYEDTQEVTKEDTASKFSVSDVLDKLSVICKNVTPEVQSRSSESTTEAEPLSVPDMPLCKNSVSASCSNASHNFCCPECPQTFTRYTAFLSHLRSENSKLKHSDSKSDKLARESTVRTETSESVAVRSSMCDTSKQPRRRRAPSATRRSQCLLLCDEPSTARQDTVSDMTELPQPKSRRHSLPKSSASAAKLKKGSFSVLQVCGDDTSSSQTRPDISELSSPTSAKSRRRSVPKSTASTGKLKKRLFSQLCVSDMAESQTESDILQFSSSAPSKSRRRSLPKSLHKDNASGSSGRSRKLKSTVPQSCDSSTGKLDSRLQDDVESLQPVAAKSQIADRRLPKASSATGRSRKPVCDLERFHSGTEPQQDKQDTAKPSHRRPAKSRRVSLKSDCQDQPATTSDGSQKPSVSALKNSDITAERQQGKQDAKKSSRHVPAKARRSVSKEDCQTVPVGGSHKPCAPESSDGGQRKQDAKKSSRSNPSSKSQRSLPKSVHRDMSTTQSEPKKRSRRSVPCEESDSGAVKTAAVRKRSSSTSSSRDTKNSKC